MFKNPEKMKERYPFQIFHKNHKNNEQIKEVVKKHLFEVIEKTPKSHVRKLANYKKQILQINRLIVCRL